MTTSCRNLAVRKSFIQGWYAASSIGILAASNSLTITSEKHCVLQSCRFHCVLTGEECLCTSWLRTQCAYNKFVKFAARAEDKYDMFVLESFCDSSTLPKVECLDVTCSNSLIVPQHNSLLVLHCYGWFLDLHEPLSPSIFVS